MQILRWARAGVVPGGSSTKGRHLRFEDTPSLRSWLERNRKPKTAKLWKKRSAGGGGGLKVKPHHLGILNRFENWRSRVNIGLVRYDAEQFKRDMRPLYDYLKNIYGD